MTSSEEPINECFELAMCYFRGTEQTPKNLKKAFELFKKATTIRTGDAFNKTHASAMLILAEFYSIGYVSPKEPETAFSLYSKVAEHDVEGSDIAKHNLACCYRNGDGVPRDVSRAMSLLEPLANKGYPFSQWLLGMCYLNMGNADRAIELFTSAAEKGHSDAQGCLGNCYREGIGVSMNKTKALELEIVAEKQGNVATRFALANVYRIGDGVPKDVQKAIELYEKIVNQEGVNEEVFCLERSHRGWLGSGCKASRRVFLRKTCSVPKGRAPRKKPDFAQAKSYQN
jgi:TPR repeat protein